MNFVDIIFRIGLRICPPKLGRLIHHAPLPMGFPARHVLSGDIDLPRISIVTPSFQQVGFIGRTIDSVLEQPKASDLDLMVASADVVQTTLRVESAKVAGKESPFGAAIPCIPEFGCGEFGVTPVAWRQVPTGDHDFTGSRSCDRKTLRIDQGDFHTLSGKSDGQPLLENLIAAIDQVLGDIPGFRG